MNEIFQLAVGLVDGKLKDADFTFGMQAVGKSLEQNGNELAKLWGASDSEDFVKLAPTYARLLLEQSLAIILGRLDPIRFVSIIRGASSPDFMIGQRNVSSFSWTKDVLPAVKLGGSSLWSQETLAKSMHRAMLDGHLAEYLFSSAHRNLIEHLTDKTSTLNELSDWVINMQKIEKGEDFLGVVRKTAGETYSSLSKGMHFEFFKGGNTALTKPEIKAAISNAIGVAATTGLYSHFTDVALQKIPFQEAISHYLFLTNKFECK